MSSGALMGRMYYSTAVVFISSHHIRRRPCSPHVVKQSHRVVPPSPVTARRDRRTVTPAPPMGSTWAEEWQKSVFMVSVAIVVVVVVATLR